MLLKRLELLGFKSFANRAVFEFDPGISVLVGPNGSGKSNVADGVRWVLGEQSARALRGKKAEEVIFVGSSARHPLGMAEVALVLDNSERRLPLEYAEVRLARRLYRSGESEYLVNGARARRKDLVNLLLQVGLHSQGYTVIGQGAVEELVMQRPEERRAVLEHAADITRHQARLQETRSRLDEATHNLTRCQDVIVELEPHARRLRGQAERVERYVARRAELAAVARVYFRGALTEANEVDARAAAELERSTTTCDQVEARIGALEADRSVRRIKVAELDAELGELRSAVEAAHREREIALRALATGRERLGFLSARAEARLGDARRAEERLAELSPVASEAPDQPVANGPDDQARLASLDRRVDALTAQLRQARRRLESARESRGRLEQQRLAIEQEAVRIRERELRRHQQQAEAAARRAAQEERLAELVGTLRTLENEAAAAAQRLQSTSEALTGAQRATAARRPLLAQARDREQQLRAGLELARATLATIDREAASGRGSGGPRSGPVERLGARLEVPAEYQPAIAAALGEWAEAFVVKDPPAAMELLAGRPNGRSLAVSCTPDIGLTAPHSLGDLLGDLWHIPAVEVVRAAGPAELLAGSPLSATVVVRDDGDARLAADRLRQGGARHWQVVTLGGVVLNDFGAARGSESAAERLLSHTRRRAEAEAARHSAEDEHRGAAEALERLGLEREAAESRERECQAAQQAAAAEARLLARRVDEVRTERGRVEEALRRLPEPARAGHDVNAASSAARSEQLAGQDAVVAEQEQTEAARIQQLQAEWEGRWAEREALRGRVQRALAEQRARHQQREASTREAERLRRDQAQAEAEAHELQTELAQLRPRLDALDARANSLAEELSDLTGGTQARAAHRVALVSGLEELERDLSDLRRQLAYARSARETALVARQRAADDVLRLSQEAESVAEEWGIEGAGMVQLRLPGEAPPAGGSVEVPEPNVDLPAARKRLGALQRELRSQGAIGESILEEYREVDERLRFLTAQSADLRRAMDELQVVIGELEALMRQGFGEAFQRVNAAFEKTFATLFNGGTARLAMTDPSDPLRTGVDIVAQPPGKRLQNLMSLSGGERALTSTALIFALLATNPLPFCVLDEVDAALDEPNARRFSDLLREYAERTQFIVVTHNRATMETAGNLYGISMGGDGVTTVVSLRPADALASARNGSGHPGKISVGLRRPGSDV